MSFFQNPNFYIQTAEADIIAFFKKAEADGQALEQDFLSALGWVQANASEIAGFVAGLLGLVAAATGGNIPVALITAQQLLTQGIQLVNSALAAAQQEKSGGGSVTAQTLAALQQGYALIKQAQAAGATQAAATSTPVAAAP